VGAVVHETRRGVERGGRRTLFLEALGCEDNAGQERTRHMFVQAIRVNFLEEIGDDFARRTRGDFDKVYLSESIVLGVMINIDNGNFVENVRVFFGKGAERFFVGRDDNDDQVERKLCRNERKISRINGALFGRDENVVFVCAAFGADGDDVVSRRVEGKNEFADARYGIGDVFGQSEEGKPFLYRSDAAPREGDGLLFLFEEVCETDGGSEGVAIRVFGDEDEDGGGFFEKFFQLVFGRNRHTGRSEEKVKEAP